VEVAMLGSLELGEMVELDDRHDWSVMVAVPHRTDDDDWDDDDFDDDDDDDEWEDDDWDDDDAGGD
jgi:hypothetical protein